MPYAMYLRKSRQDAEAELAGQGETLARHRAALLELAQRLGLSIQKEYAEVASGESIQDRPRMQELLQDVSAGLWEGVLVMEVERLARGDTKDQGIVQQAFTFSATRIITPARTYDPTDPADAQYFEFGLFFSRMEYNGIKRRLIAGRERAVREGKWPNPNCPYGYRVVHVEKGKGYTLAVVPEEAEVVRLIFSWYVNGMPSGGELIPAGSGRIARRLNEMGVVTQAGGPWSPAAVRTTLRNIAYTGKVRWYQTGVQRRMQGERVVKRVKETPERTLVVEGLHPAIVSAALFEAAQARLSANSVPRAHHDYALQNPFAGLAVCGQCGHKLRRSAKGEGEPGFLRCFHPGCPCKGCQLERFERKVLAVLESWVKDYEVRQRGKPVPAGTGAEESAILRCEHELAELKKQRDNLYKLLERGVYSDEVFFERQKAIEREAQDTWARKNALAAAIAAKRSMAAMQEHFIPAVYQVLEDYPTLASAQEKNALLKTVIAKISYERNESGHGKDPDAFVLKVFPILPVEN